MAKEFQKAAPQRYEEWRVFMKHEIDPDTHRILRVEVQAWEKIRDNITIDEHFAYALNAGMYSQNALNPKLLLRAGSVQPTQKWMVELNREKIPTHDDLSPTDSSPKQAA